MAGRISRSLAERGFEGAKIAIVLGSGLGGISRRLERAQEVPFVEVDGMPRSTVPGHAGRFVLGTLAGERILVQEGRVHLYEGWSAPEVCGSIRAFAGLGCRAVVLTNAAGSLRPAWKPPLLMRLDDHIDRQGRTPLAPGTGGRGSLYDQELGEALESAATSAGVPLARGVYAGLLGPSYETPAEIRMLAWMGADAVGMSTVIEAQAAHDSGLRVAAVSCITNLAAGIGAGPLSHEEVIEEAAAATEQIASLLSQAVPCIARAITLSGRRSE